MLYSDKRASDQIQAFPLHFLFYIFLMEKKKTLGLAGLGCLELTDSISNLQETFQPLQWTLGDRAATEKGDSLRWQPPDEGSNRPEGWSIYDFTKDSIKVINKRAHGCECTAWSWKVPDDRTQGWWLWFDLRFITDAVKGTDPTCQWCSQSSADRLHPRTRGAIS